MFKKYTFIIVGLLLFLNIAAGQNQPNVIIVIVDDQGYGDLSCHGNPIVKTPHFDKLHQESVRFTDYHVAPMCTPTRGQLMTGTDCLRNRAMNVSSGRTLLSLDYKTLPEVLKNNGFATGLFGKWHLGDNYPYRPHDRGFDEAIWFPSSHIGSVPDTWLNDYFDDTYLHRNTRQQYKGYTTDVFFQEAMTWMKQQKNAKKPFFTFIATAAPHSPLYVPPQYFERAMARVKQADLPQLDDNGKRDLAKFLGMIENVDDNMGRLDTFLKQENLFDNTIVIYMTDNGSTMGEKYYNAGMRGNKVTLWEGGHRVPLFIRGTKGAFGEARDIKQLTQVQDIFPTVLDLVGVKNIPKTDGLSLAGLLKNTTQDLPDRKLVIHYSRMPVNGRTSTDPQYNEGAVMWQQWRLIEDKKLYNIEKDPMQKQDVAAVHPDIVKAMQTHYAAWWEDIKEKVNEPLRVVIGNKKDNPTLISACEWWNVFVDQQGQVRRGELKNSVVHLTVEKAGVYEFELSRWAKEADLPFSAPAPAATLTDGKLSEGVALKIEKATLKIGNFEKTVAILPTDKTVRFKVKLAKGDMALSTLLASNDGATALGAYYVYVKKM
jgi:arylsulfatase A-like enzyme